MSALGFALVAGGSLLIYAGMTGGSLVKAVQQVVDGKAGKAAEPATPTAGARPAGDRYQP